MDSSEKNFWVDLTEVLLLLILLEELENFVVVFFVADDNVGKASEFLRFVHGHLNSVNWTKFGEKFVNFLRRGI